MPNPEEPKLYGLLVEFDDAEELVAAARAVRAQGYRRVDAYTPMPVEGLAKAVGMKRTNMPLVVLLGGVFGGLSGFGLQYWVSVYAFPLNIGGRPLNSWPAFIPVTFETTVLGAALFGVLGMLALNGLPRPHHPLFAVPEFARATQTGFFLCLEAKDRKFDAKETRAELAQLTGKKVIDGWKSE
jgi:hypothetical protein